MDYDRIFEDDINKKFFYSDYPGSKLVVGTISLKNAMQRLSMDEYYVLVTYNHEEQLPEQYVPFTKTGNEDGVLFATVNPNMRFSDICNNGGIQRISKLPNAVSGSPRFLLGPGPDEVELFDLIIQQLEKYNKSSKIAIENVVSKSNR